RDAARDRVGGHAGGRTGRQIVDAHLPHRAAGPHHARVVDRLPPREQRVAGDKTVTAYDGQSAPRQRLSVQRRSRRWHLCAGRKHGRACRHGGAQVGTQRACQPSRAFHVQLPGALIDQAACGQRCGGVLE
ncbi:MAG: hypothetical protein ACK56I_09475, partial [bacterium]